MKSIFLALALIATGVHAAEDTDSTPCDGIENDKQTLECATYNKTTAEQLLKDNYQGLLERMGSTYGSNKSQLADITARLKDAQQKWENYVTPIARWTPSRRRPAPSPMRSR